MADYAQQQQYPNLNPYSGGANGQNTASFGSNASAGQQVEGTKNTMMSKAQSAMDSVQNHPAVQNIQNGPMADKARQETAQVQGEFSNLANSRQTPDTKTATGQPLTHYHSLFYTLLSWENPRATAISYAAIVLAIFASRYLPIVRYGLRLTWIVTGITAAAEIAGRMVFDQGFASKMRPKKYYTIPRETLESSLEDLEQLINFFVIEVQRIVFAENIYATVGAFASALTTYFLIKVTPAWGLALIFATVIYFVPLVYISNKELIDSHLENAGNIVSQQSQQVRDLASQHTSKAMEVGSQTINQYSNKAKEMMGQTKGKAVDQGIVSQETADQTEQSLRQAPSAPAMDPTHNPAGFQAQQGRAEPMAAQY
ncbi:hypothetical protein LTR91_001464 [Friedmanniomyces endolithicus]|uniref:Reticulon-like protein n=1 Tax=Friedmanniomyces endolithicus TaxID=329885 RepID=A0A4V5N6P1_9PEZI|nr:hypothetical protein LTS09_008104 [Friedmanniomyces endolithicus]KAK0282478.1 hypothetical protein LTR35_006946 [Friedmanniomyces endolithicus]KAK0296111.1 hypothetical protein LTS00_005397 [Friedmanniomyces endolithicus]KAK0316709.1 hypothetical protein LTR01_000459 [Friedmanniomyces endolithicus]KAK0327915.1 hypothetical protein LTR82_001433 [Friedmanniomyces endolithicus]